MQRAGRGNRRNARAPVRSNLNNSDHLRITQMSKQLNGSTPVRTQKNRQLVSVPNHNYSLKVRKVFRIRANATGVSPFILDIGGIYAAVRNELGIAFEANTGELISIYSGHVYGVVPQPGTLASSVSNSLIVAISDVEETSTAGSNRIALFEDFASPAGISHVSWFHPVNNRPTFNRGTSSATQYLSVAYDSLVTTVIDLELEYTRIPAATN